MTNNGKRRVVALAITFGVIFVALPLIGMGLASIRMTPKPDIEGYAIMLLKTFDDRNKAAVAYFERIKRDPATAAELRAQADEARALGESVRRSLLIAQPANDAKAKFEQYIGAQCAIAKKAEDALAKNPVWAKASYYRDSYNRVTQNDMTIFEKLFGSKRLLAGECK